MCSASAGELQRHFAKADTEWWSRPMAAAWGCECGPQGRQNALLLEVIKECGTSCVIGHGSDDRATQAQLNSTARRPTRWHRPASAPQYPTQQAAACVPYMFASACSLIRPQTGLIPSLRASALQSRCRISGPRGKEGPGPCSIDRRPLDARGPAIRSPPLWFADRVRRHHRYGVITDLHRGRLGHAQRRNERYDFEDDESGNDRCRPMMNQRAFRLQYKLMETFSRIHPARDADAGSRPSRCRCTQVWQGLRGFPP